MAMHVMYKYSVKVKLVVQQYYDQSWCRDSKRIHFYIFLELAVALR